MNPNANPPGLFGMFPDKVFPEEVENIKEFMKDTFTTNVNGFIDENGFNLNRDFENDNLSNLQVSPMNEQQFNNARYGNSNDSSMQNFNNQNNNNNNQNQDSNSPAPRQSGNPITSLTQIRKMQTQNNHKSLKRLR